MRFVVLTEDAEASRRELRDACDDGSLAAALREEGVDAESVAWYSDDGGGGGKSSKKSKRADTILAALVAVAATPILGIAFVCWQQRRWRKFGSERVSHDENSADKDERLLEFEPANEPGIVESKSSSSDVILSTKSRESTRRIKSEA